MVRSRKATGCEERVKVGLDGTNPLGIKAATVFSHVLVVRAGKAPIEDGAIAIDGDLIVDVGTADEVMERHPEALVVDGAGYMVTPGLVNSHTHAALAFFRGLGHGRESMIETFLFPAEKSETPELIEPLALSYIYGGLRSGVTCFVDHYYYVLGIGKALARFGLRGVLGETVADLGSAFPDTTGERWAMARYDIENWPFDDRIVPAVAPHATDTVSEKLLKDAAAFARVHKVPLHMHLSQTTGERKRVMAREKMSPVQFAKKCKALSPSSLVVHLVSADEKDLKILADTGVTVGFCPASQVIYERLSPVAGFVKHDIPLALGNDCAASNDSADILAELRTAALLMRDRGVGEEAVEPSKLLEMVTTNPANVLGLGKMIGKIEAGFKADLVFMERDLASEPMFAPATNLVYSMGANHVRHVMVDGKWVLWNRSLPGLSESDLRREYQDAVEEIMKRIGRPTSTDGKKSAKARGRGKRRE